MAGSIRQAVADAITDKTILVSIMHSNNETGTIQPIEAIAKITREHKIICTRMPWIQWGGAHGRSEAGCRPDELRLQHLLRPHGRRRPLHPAREP
jgi:kynureninase